MQCNAGAMRWVCRDKPFPFLCQEMEIKMRNNVAREQVLYPAHKLQHVGCSVQVLRTYLRKKNKAKQNDSRMLEEWAPIICKLDEIE